MPLTAEDLQIDDLVLAINTREPTMTAPRVVTLTPAPAIDRVYFLDRVQEGHVNRAAETVSYLAGKGINVARALHLAGNTVSAVLPLGGDDLGHSDPFMPLVKGVEVKHPVRTNTILVDGSGTTTNINARPGPLSPAEWFRLGQTALDEIQRIGADWFVVGGALPLDAATGRAVDIRPLLRAARAMGAAVCLDVASGEVLSAWEPECQPDLIKPNAAELAAMTGKPVRSLGDVVEAASLLRKQGVGTVLASVGGAGVVEVSDRGVLWARGPQVRVVNTTGAGDAALAGYLSATPGANADHSARATALRRSVAWGALAVEQPTTVLPHIIAWPSGIVVGAPEPTQLID